MRGVRNIALYKNPIEINDEIYIDNNWFSIKEKNKTIIDIIKPNINNLGKTNLKKRLEYFSSRTLKTDGEITVKKNIIEPKRNEKKFVIRLININFK